MNTKQFKNILQPLKLVMTELNPENVAPKPDKRAVAKIWLNSLWGKFDQRQNITQTEYVSDVQR